MITKNKSLALALVAICWGATQTSLGLAEEYVQVAALMDIRTQFSDGAHSLEYLVGLARERNFEVLFVTDHDRIVLEYGIWPLGHILKKRVEKPSINKTGAEKYLKMIESASKKFPDMILIPGAESAPFYYWEGSYFKKNLTVCDWERHLIIVGLEKPEDYRNLPILHNGSSPKYVLQSFSAGFFITLIPLAFGLVLIRRRGKIRYFGLAVMALTLLLVVNNHLFRSSPYDQYHGSQGIAPYQLVIDYVNSRGGMAFWNHPETLSGVGSLGPVYKKTLPYPSVLAESKNYTGFAALYGDTITVTEPGNLWDQVLMEYCLGRREKPAWGISTADFHEEGGAGEKLGNFPTIFLVKNKTKESILDALKRGRMYASRGFGDAPRLILEDFSVSDSETQKKGIMGEEISVKGSPTIHIRVSGAPPAGKNSLSVRLIRSGRLLKTFSGEIPFSLNFTDEFPEPRKGSYYRLEAEDGKGRKLISNPVFVTFQARRD
jgi:hypothetical protein